MARTDKSRSPALAYLRTSSAANVGTDKDSEKRQRHAIQGFAKRAGFGIVDEFYDAAVSGADPIETRAGFAALLDRIEGNGVRTVIVEDASRFARELPSFLVPTGLHKKLCTLLAGKPDPAFGLHLTEPGDRLIVECQCCHGIGVRDRCHSRQDVQGEREIDLGAGALEDGPCLIDERDVAEPVPHLKQRARPLDGHAHGLGGRNAPLPST